MSLLLSIKEVSKVYSLDDNTPSSFREAVSTFFQKKEALSQPFIALDKATFNLHEGEIIGITGANGAGKSTLLKILSEISYSTDGQIDIYGRMASMLEIGTGFHPELTGRENVYFNASLLGMSRAETKRKFEQIVSFSEIGEFIDIPVKRYSSGMYVRLAFSVAVHTNVNILLIDEVLAVGDIRFQDKCKTKIRELVEKGVGVIIVSHNLNMLEEFAARLILINKGKIVYDGNTKNGLSLYSQMMSQSK